MKWRLLIQSAAGFALLRVVPNPSPKPVSEVLRRAGSTADQPPIILGDTMGELRKFYSLADVVFVGRSLVNLGSKQWGSDMIEPAALAKPVAIGPWTHNFAESQCGSFKAANAMVEVPRCFSSRSRQSPVGYVIQLLPLKLESVGAGCRAIQSSATARHVELMLRYLPL